MFWGVKFVWLETPWGWTPDLHLVACVRSDQGSQGRSPLITPLNNSLGYHLHYHTKGLDEGDDAPGLWRSPEHVHLSIGCESMDHTDTDNKKCPYHRQRAVDNRDERNKRPRMI